MLAPGGAAGRDDAAGCIDILRNRRVGGSFWGPRPEIPAAARLLLAPANAAQAGAMLAAAADAGYDAAATAMIAWDEAGANADANAADANADAPAQRAPFSIKADHDPWHLFDHFDQIWADADGDFALLARIAGKNPIFWDAEKAARTNPAHAGDEDDIIDAFIRRDFGAGRPLDPFTQAPMTLIAAARQLCFWKELIEQNRDIDFAAGFAFWKRPTVAPLLWPGARGVPFTDDLTGADAHSVAAVWTSRLPRKARDQIARIAPQIIEVEDGFIRSSGLGANCVPPLSIIADRRGIYFDPNKPSDLEHILQHADIPPEMQAQAAALRRAIVAAAISKYGGKGTMADVETIRKSAHGRKIILVPGQVEDDRSVLSGGSGVSGNLQLLERVRAQEADAFILYKPHPDVEAGHRKGQIGENATLQFADHIARESAIIPLLELSDHIHVLTSLTGFEALLRHKPVTTHGAPFYAGWGLTEDLGDIPMRRSRRRNLDELIAASLILYARYLDPVTGLPCPADILIRRLQDGLAIPPTPLTRFRQCQGFARLILSKGVRLFVR